MARVAPWGAGEVHQRVRFPPRVLSNICDNWKGMGMSSPKPIRVRMVRKEYSAPSSENMDEFVHGFAKMVEAGEFDAYLDVIWQAANDRLRVYFDSQGKPDDPQELRARKLRQLRNPPKIVVGDYYEIFGDKFTGVIVKVLGHVDETEGDVSKVRVQVATGNDKYLTGSVYKLLAGALEEIKNRNQTDLRKIYQ
jgi:hypothetical protein